MLGLLFGVLVLFAIVVTGSLQIVDPWMRRVVVGLLSCASLISMFASPLFIIVSYSRQLWFITLPWFIPYAKMLISFYISSSFLYPESGDPNKEC